MTTQRQVTEKEDREKQPRRDPSPDRSYEPPERPHPGADRPGEEPRRPQREGGGAQPGQR